MLNLVGQKVIHKLNHIGEGEITGFTGKYITVLFYDSTESKIFPYPGVFINQFIKLKDPKMDAILQQEINHVIEDKEELDDFSDCNDAEKSDEELDEKKRGQKIIFLASHGSMEGFVDDYIKSITHEMYYLRNHGGKHYRLQDGIKIETKNGTSFVYNFESETEMNFPCGIEVSVWDPDGIISGTLIDCDEFNIILSIEKNYGEAISEIEFSVNPWALMNSLNERLKNMKQEYSWIAESLVTDGKNKVFNGYSYIESGQEVALKNSLKNPITFIWGPPGTGKTQTLANISIEHIKKGNSVLMLSYSNVSVDEATLRVFDMFKENAKGTVLRYGYPKMKEIQDHPYLSSYNYVLSKYENIFKERQELIEEKNRLSKDNPRTLEIALRLNQIREEINKHEKMRLIRQNLWQQQYQRQSLILLFMAILLML